MTQYMNQSSETYTPDALIAGETQIVSRTAVLVSSQGVLKRGTLMGQVAATGKLVVSVQAANDGSQIPFGVLYDDYDTSAGDVTGGVYVKGEFNGNAMTFGAGWNTVNAFGPMRAVGLWLKPVVGASGQYSG